MTPPGNPLRLLVAVAPALLADVLCLALRHEGLDVVLYDTDDAAPDSGPHEYKVAVVTDELPENIDAHAVIRLPDLPSSDLVGVVDVVRAELAGYPGGALGSSTV